MPNISETRDLVAVLPPDVPIAFIGAPGLGKSACAQLIRDHIAAEAKQTGAAFRSARWELTSHVPEDASGCPKITDDGDWTKFCPPEKLGRFACGSGPNGTDPYGVLVLEDFTQAQQAVQNAFLQLIQERSIGDLQMSPHVRILITGNRTQDKAGARELPAPLKNRCCRLDVEPDLEEWMYWAAGNKLPAVIGGFLSYKPGFFVQYPTNADKENGQYATPRSWANLGRLYEAVVKHGKGDLGPLSSVAAGLVGVGVATEFVAFVRLQKELPNPKAVLDDPKGALPHPPEQPDRLAAMVTALGEYAAANQHKDKKVYIKLLLALAHVSSKGGREGCAAGVSVFQANGGDVAKLVDAADKHKKDPRVFQVLKFFAEATK